VRVDDCRGPHMGIVKQSQAQVPSTGRRSISSRRGRRLPLVRLRRARTTGRSRPLGSLAAWPCRGSIPTRTAWSRKRPSGRRQRRAILLPEMHKAEGESSIALGKSRAASPANRSRVDGRDPWMEECVRRVGTTGERRPRLSDRI
jgi:hypothetical protein